MKEIEQEILEILEKNPEEFKHAKDTLKWLLIIKPDAVAGLRIAVLGHDIERAIKPWENNEDIHTKEFREKHAERSANIIKDLLKKHNADEEEIQRICKLILMHEFGEMKSKT